MIQLNDITQFRLLLEQAKAQMATSGAVDFVWIYYGFQQHFDPGAFYYGATLNYRLNQPSPTIHKDFLLIKAEVDATTLGWVPQDLDASRGLYHYPQKVYSLGGDRYSVIPPETLERFGTPLSLTDEFAKFGNIASSQSLWVSGWSRRRQIDEFLKTQMSWGTHAGFSLLPKELAKRFKEQVGKTKGTAIEIKYLTSSRLSAQISVRNMKAAQFVSSNRVFVYETPVMVLDPQTREHKQVQLVRLGMFASSDKKLLKNKEAREQLKSLVGKLLENGGLAIFDLDRLIQEMKKKAGRLLQYHSGLSLVLGEKVAEIPYWNAVESSMENQDHLTTKHYQYLDNYGRIANSNEHRSHKKAAEALEQAQQKLRGYEADAEAYASSANTTELNIERYKKQIETWTSQAITAREQEKTWRQKAETYKSSIAILENQKKLASEKLDQFTTQILKEASSGGEYSDWYANFLKSGILVRDVTYRVNRQTYSLRSYPEIVNNPQARLYEVEYFTTKPIIIKVDAQKNTGMNVVAGPFHVKLVDKDVDSPINQGRINVDILVKPASPSSIFGIKDYGGTLGLVWSPHTQEVQVPKDPAAIDAAIQTQWRTGCRGEVVQTLYYAYEAKDPREAIITSLLWLSNANSEDQWGKQYLYFPTPDQVTLDPSAKQPEPEPEEPEEEEIEDEDPEDPEDAISAMVNSTGYSSPFQDDDY